MKAANIITGVLSIAAALIIAVFSYAMPAGKQGVPGPGAFSLMICLLMLLAGSSVLISAMKMEGKDSGSLIPEAVKKRVFILMAITVAYVIGVFALGYLVASAIFITAVVRWFGKYRMWKCVLTGFGVAAFIYLVFTQVLQVPLFFGILV